MKLNWKLELTTNQVFFLLIGLGFYVVFDQVFNNQTWNLGSLLGLITGVLFFFTKGDSKAFYLGSTVVLSGLFMALAAGFAAPAGASVEFVALGMTIFNVTVGSQFPHFAGWLLSIAQSEKSETKEVEEQK